MAEVCTPKYQRRLRAANALDFDDLIGETVAVLQRHPSWYYRRRFPAASWSTGPGPTTRSTSWCVNKWGVRPGHRHRGALGTCVVGDAKPIIYAFRGGDDRNIEDFRRRHNATTILLEQNYRSTQTILSAANSGDRPQHRPARRDSGPTPETEELIVGYVADSEHDEARFVAAEIDSLIGQ